MACCGQRDNIYSLKEKDRNAIKESWLNTKGHMEEIGMACFINLFKQFPEAQDLFDLFKDKPLNELEDNPYMHGHALRVMRVFGVIVQNLDDPKAMRDVTLVNGQRHADFDITLQEMKGFEVIFLEQMKICNGKSWNESHAEAWSKLFDFIIPVTIEGMASVKKNA